MAGYRGVVCVGMKLMGDAVWWVAGAGAIIMGPDCRCVTNGRSKL